VLDSGYQSMAMGFDHVDRVDKDPQPDFVVGAKGYEARYPVGFPCSVTKSALG